MRPTTLITSFTSLTLTLAAHIPHPQRQTTFSSSNQEDGTHSNQEDDNAPSLPLPSTAALAALEALNNAFYSPTAGQWSPSDAWWVSGNAYQSLLDYMHKTNSRNYMDQALHIFALQRQPLSWWPQGGGDFRADSTDDTGWWALSMIRLFDITGDETYLNISIADEEYIAQYWSDEVCGGGVYVDIRARTYKNAIANQLYVLLAASIHNRLPGGGGEYLEKAVKGWKWLRGSGMIGGEGLFNDGLAMRGDGTTCFNNGLPVWTYNQGVVLGAAAELYRATKNTSYLTFARSIADKVLASKSLIQHDGILTESCEADSAGCNGDQQIFKGIFARNLADLDSCLDGNPYREFLEKNARRAHEADRDGSNLHDICWAGPYAASSLAKQASVLSLWVALI